MGRRHFAIYSVQPQVAAPLPCSARLQDINTANRLTGATCTHFFEKKDMMLLPPGFAPFFPAAVVVDLLMLVVGGTLILLGAGSSSEKDSHVASSLVTAIH